MYVKAHVVAKAVGLEEAGNAFCHHLVKVSLHYSKGREAFKHLAGRCQVHFTVGDAGLGERECVFVAFVDYLVYLTLLCGELPCSGICAGEV